MLIKLARPTLHHCRAAASTIRGGLGQRKQRRNSSPEKLLYAELEAKVYKVLLGLQGLSPNYRVCYY